MNVILLGYMGSGKSSLGKALAHQLEYDFKDLDEFIEKEEQLTVPKIFETKGEIYFRKKETLYLQKLLVNDTNSIISLGGGTPCFGSNMKLIIEKKHNISIYLEASIPELVNRLFHAKSGRPLIAHIGSKKELEEFIAKHLFERSYYYNQSKLKIKTDQKNILALVKEIKNLLQNS